VPASLQVAQPATVLPHSLCSAFSEQRSFPIVANEPYVDRRTQRSFQANISRKAWSLGKRLAYTEWLALRDFFRARKGMTQPFYFYPNNADHDPTGTSVTGQFTVRFQGALSETYNVGRHGIELALVEIA
jgi:hypothetical protein